MQSAVNQRRRSNRRKETVVRSFEKTEVDIMKILNRNHIELNDLVPIVLSYLHMNALGQNHRIEFDYDKPNLKRPTFIAKSNLIKVTENVKDHHWLNTSRPEYCNEDVFVVANCSRKIKGIKKWSYLEQLNECVLYSDPCNSKMLNMFISLYDCITVCFRNKK